MLKFILPNKTLEIVHIVMDYNGTLATDGKLLPGVADRLKKLAPAVHLYVMTADTFGTAGDYCRELPVKIYTVNTRLGAADKEKLINTLGPEQTIAIGNGMNDVLMLKKAALGILILGEEGAALQALQAADVVFKHINDALDFLLKRGRLIATLRP
ncbi:MAG: hypothetical protein PWP65_939 [Clostridia bacterium]|nr:hypothetical protein [Clostridia bacterium]